jgi:hypothetical protein
VKVPGRGAWESYKPNEYQKAFHEVPAWSERMVKGPIGGVGAGKSTACENEQVELCLRMPNGISVATRKSQKRARFALVDDYMKILSGVAEWRAKDEAFRFPNGHQLVVMPSDDYQRFGSLEICSFFIQEAHELDDPKIFSTLCDRLRSPYGKINGEYYYRGYIDARGVTSSHWINRDFIEKAWNYERGPAARQNASNPDFVYFRGRTEQNRQNLPKGYIEALRRQHKNDVNWIKVFLEGEVGFDVEGRAVFGDSWDYDRHVADISEDPSLPILRSWDFGYRAPAVTWWQYTHSGRLLQLRELCPENVSTDELIQMAQALQLDHWRDRPRYTYRDYGDIAGEQISASASSTDVEKVETFFGTALESRKARIEDGLNVLRKLMRDSVKLQGRLVPRFAVDASCRVSIEAYAGAYYYKDGPNLMDRLPVKGTGYDRVVDTARYVGQLVIEEGYIPTPAERISHAEQPGYFGSYTG